MPLMCFDCGGSSIKYAVYADNKLKDKGQMPTAENWINFKKDCLKQYQAAQKKYSLSGVAFSLPGAVDLEQGIVDGVSAIPYLHKHQVKEELETFFNCPVSIENDAHAAALAELWQGSAQAYEDIIFLVIGSGVGGALINNGELIRGNNLFAAEFGLMILDGKNSVSTLVSPVTMGQSYSLALGLEPTAVEGKTVFDKAAAKEPLALHYVNKFYDHLSLAVYNLIFCYDPQAIIIGGAVSQQENLSKEINDRVRERLKKNNLQQLNYCIRTCHFNNDANLIGAAYSHIQQIERRD